MRVQHISISAGAHDKLSVFCEREHARDCQHLQCVCQSVALQQGLPCVDGSCEVQAKPDMVANKDLRATLTPEGVYGHIKGIPVGQTFANKGELAILGLHGNINSGIHSKCAH